LRPTSLILRGLFIGSTKAINMDFLRDGYLKRYFKIVPTILFLLIFESANSSIGDLEISFVDNRVMTSFEVFIWLRLTYCVQ